MSPFSRGSGKIFLFGMSRRPTLSLAVHRPPCFLLNTPRFISSDVSCYVYAEPACVGGIRYMLLLTAILSACVVICELPSNLCLNQDMYASSNSMFGVKMDRLSLFYDRYVDEL